MYIVQGSSLYNKRSICYMRGRCFLKYNDKYICYFSVSNDGYYIKYCDDRHFALSFQTFRKALSFVKMVNIYCPHFMRHVTIV